VEAARKSSAGAACPICLRQSSLTDEDITPTWARKHLIRSYGPFPGAQAPRRHKFRICMQCNGQLGRRFEEPVAPILKHAIDGIKLRLSMADQRAIGSWVVKTTMLTCLADSTPQEWGHGIAREIVQGMLKTGVPPINSSVRLGIINDSSADAGPARYIGNLLPVGRMPEFAFFSLTSMGHLVWEAVIGVAPNVERFARWTDGRTDRMIRVWPAREIETAWPPPKALHYGQILAMRDAFVAARLDVPGLADPRRRTWDGPVSEP
jgi:hypothetical protein